MSKLKQDMVVLGYEFSEFWLNFSKTIDAIPDNNVEMLTSTWYEYFIQHRETTLKLIKISLKVEELVESGAE